MIKTAFFEDSINYYKKAAILQNRNLGLIDKSTDVNDPLMMNVSIYDNINRRYAGFNKPIEDIMDTRAPVYERRLKAYNKTLDSYQLHFLYLFHRYTGSGASFEPRYLKDGSLNPREHGYCNSIVGDIAEILEKTKSFEAAQEFIVKYDKAFCTSIGNQGPSLKNPHPEKYRLSVQYYFDTFAVPFIKDYITFLMNYEYENNKPCGIKQAVDYCCAWNKQRGLKQWHFILTAFVMDTAEYFPELVDPKSHCYYGSNCIRTMDLCFIKEKTDKEKGNDWYERCMNEWVQATGGNPYELEDAPGCDIIRYWKEHVPKGYEHLTIEQKRNNSTLKVDGEYPQEIQERLLQVLG